MLTMATTATADTRMRRRQKDVEGLADKTNKLDSKSGTHHICTNSEPDQFQMKARSLPDPRGTA